MTNIIKNNLKFKIFLPVIILYLTVNLIIYLITVDAVKTTLQEQFISKGKTVVNTLASSIQEIILNRDPSTVQGYLDQYRNVDDISFIIIFDENNMIIAPTFYPKVPQTYLKAANEKLKSDLVVNEEVLNGDRELVIARPILNGLLGRIYMGMGIEKRENEIIKPLLKKIVLIMSVCSVFVVFVINMLLNIILRPIIDLTSVAEEYSNGRVSVLKNSIKASDEVGRLTESFYKMIDKIIENTKKLEHEVENRTEIIDKQQLTLLYASKMSALGEMAGGIAHEINTPLAIIGMKVELLNESIDDDDINPEEFKNCLNVIKKTTERIARIIKGLRYFSGDPSKLPIRKVSLDSILDETLNFWSEKNRLHSIELSIKKESETHDIFLNCKSVEISQVLINLLNNCIDAITNSPEKWIYVIVKDFEKDVEISIVDSGDGVPEELQEKIMQPFFTTKEIGTGTGVGLSISCRIVESYHGKLYFDKNSKNTKFTILLPKCSFEDELFSS